MTSGRVTLAALAAHLGLSKFAVSRALAGKSGVSETTRRRVEIAAAEFGYVRVVQERAQPVIALIFNDNDLVNSELQLRIHAGVHVAAQQSGYKVSAKWTHDVDEIEATLRGCDGGIVVGNHDTAVYRRIDTAGVPVIRAGGWPDPLERVDMVGGTDHEAGAAVASYLLELGHRDIAFVHGAPRYRGRIERLSGMREVLERRRDTSFHDVRFEPELSFTQHLRALWAAGIRPTAFFCAHDGLAVTVVSELLRLGYHIPEDASVIGFGDYSSATQISPQLTTVTLQGFERGQVCVRLLDDRLNHRLPRHPVRIMLTGELIHRASSGPAPALPRTDAA